MALIYKLNNINGKSYIGQTVQKFDNRWTDHKSAARNKDKKDGCRALNNAIRLHGEDCWTREVLIYCNKEHLDDYEIAFIKLYDTLAPNGYNLRTGGQSKGQVSEETKKLMSESAKKRDNDCYRKDQGLLGYKYITQIHTPAKNPRKHGYLIHRHALCAYQSFVSSDINKMEYNKQRAINRLNELNKLLEEQKGNI